MFYIGAEINKTFELKKLVCCLKDLEIQIALLAKVVATLYMRPCV